MQAPTGANWRRCPGPAGIPSAMISAKIRPPAAVSMQGRCAPCTPARDQRVSGPLANANQTRDQRPERQRSKAGGHHHPKPEVDVPVVRAVGSPGRRSARSPHSCRTSRPAPRARCRLPVLPDLLWDRTDIVVVGRGSPFPHIARHVQGSIGAGSLGIAAHCAPSAQACLREVQQFPGWILVAPGIGPAIGPPTGLLPFGLRGQPAAGPFGVCPGPGSR